MTSIDELQARATALLTKTESTESVEAKVASTEGPSRRFSPFIPSELDRADRAGRRADDDRRRAGRRRRARRGGAADGDRGRRARPPRAGDVHRARPGGGAARDPADPAAGGEARGGAARRRDRAGVGARLVPRGPAGQRPPPPLAHRLSRSRPPRARRGRPPAGPPGRAVLLHAPADARALRRRAAGRWASIPWSRSPTTARRSARATRIARAARRCATSTATTPARC